MHRPQDLSSSRMAGVPLRCFVASAFGKNDVDQIFKKCLRPVLRVNSIRAYRVDVVEHNDDIDDKIYELIDTADLVIADLTYARPSVYFEAGYALGKGIPVILLLGEIISELGILILKVYFASTSTYR